MNEVPLSASSKRPRCGADCARKLRPSHAEELGFGEAFRDRGGIERDKRLIPAWAVVVNGARDPFLASARFPLNQHGPFIGDTSFEASRTGASLRGSCRFPSEPDRSFNRARSSMFSV